MFTTKDLQSFVKRGIKPEHAKQQMENFKSGFPYMVLDRPALVGDGILLISEPELDELVIIYKKQSAAVKLLKFVPASGAATRMFKDLFDFLNTLKDGRQPVLNGAMAEFFNSLQSFAFWPALKDSVAKKGADIAVLLREKDFALILSSLLEEPGMNYGSLPKGLLYFHAYEKHSRTPLEEHLVEAALYAQGQDKLCELHLTVSSEHQSAFNTHLRHVSPEIEKAHGVKFKVGYSVQKPSTDILAADADNQPFREPDGSLVFRPGGHGALLENLNGIDADIIFIKNIDNVVPDHLKKPTVRYKMALGGLLLKIQEQVFRYGRMLQKTDTVSPEIEREIREFLEKNFSWDSSLHPAYSTSKHELLLDALKRPLRVCGMVRNDGEPGGGPFWTKAADGAISLQIVESTQIDLNNPNQQEIASRASHFNPVDLVCGVKDWNGKKYDLMQYRDPATGFIARKSKDGRELKAQELPGLWNGSMARWNTIFVEVPAETFNPVKTVNDLLRPAHQ